MDKIDKEKVNKVFNWSHTSCVRCLSITPSRFRQYIFKVVFEMSNGSKFFTKAKENDAKLDVRIEALKQKLSRWQARQLANGIAPRSFLITQ